MAMPTTKGQRSGAKDEGGLALGRMEKHMRLGAHRKGVVCPNFCQYGFFSIVFGFFMIKSLIFAHFWEIWSPI
jgi:hypothetical protein